MQEATRCVKAKSAAGQINGTKERYTGGGEDWQEGGKRAHELLPVAAVDRHLSLTKVMRACQEEQADNGEAMKVSEG